MKNILFLVLLAMAFTLACKKDREKDLPACIKTQLDAFKLGAQSCAAGSASLKTYQFQNQTVYVFDEGPCIADNAKRVLDKDCNQRCVLGGIGGITDCSGADFMATATGEFQVWP